MIVASVQQHEQEAPKRSHHAPIRSEPEQNKQVQPILVDSDIKRSEMKEHKKRVTFKAETIQVQPEPEKLDDDDEEEQPVQQKTPFGNQSLQKSSESTPFYAKNNTAPSKNYEETNTCKILLDCEILIFFR